MGNGIQKLAHRIDIWNALSASLRVRSAIASGPPMSTTNHPFSPLVQVAAAAGLPPLVLDELRALRRPRRYRHNIDTLLSWAAVVQHRWVSLDSQAVDANHPAHAQFVRLAAFLDSTRAIHLKVSVRRQARIQDTEVYAAARAHRKRLLRVWRSFARPRETPPDYLQHSRYSSATVDALDADLLMLSTAVRARIPAAFDPAHLEREYVEPALAARAALVQEKIRRGAELDARYTRDLRSVLAAMLHDVLRDACRHAHHALGYSDDAIRSYRVSPPAGG